MEEPVTILLALLLLGPACSRTPAPPERRASASGVAPQRARDAEALAPGRTAPALLETGCASALTLEGSAEQRLAALAAQCAANMRALLPAPALATLPAGSTRELTFAVTDVSRCVRVLSVGGDGVEQLELELLDGAGFSYGRNSRGNPLAMVGARGNVCLKSAGAHRAIARVLAGHGQVALQAYQVE